MLLSACTRPALRRPSAGTYRCQGFGHTRTAGAHREDGTHLVRFGFAYDQPPSFGCDIVAKDWNATDPLALAPGGRQLIARSLADDLAFKLGKREQDVEGEPAHGASSVEILRHGNEAHPALVEE